MQPKGGTKVDGLYTLITPCFKRGASADIHLAVDPLGRRVLLKTLRKDFPRRVGRAQFRKEFESLLKFCHPNVARVFHFGSFGKRVYIASEFVEGTEFRQAIADRNVRDMIPFFIQALRGLEAVHTHGMLHLDVKSSNVLVDMNGNVKVIDLGLAEVREKIAPGKICGSIPYIAPEMALQKTPDCRADLFSFGVLMYSCVCGGFSPFPRREAAQKDLSRLKELLARPDPPRAPPLDCNEECPPLLNDIILKLLSFHPEERFASARAVINALVPLQDEEASEPAAVRLAYLRPTGNRLAGREKEMGICLESLRQTAMGEEPNRFLFLIHGGKGMGKTAFLDALRQQAALRESNLETHFLALSDPAETPDPLSQEEWWEALEVKRGGNRRPVAVFLDNADSLPPNSLLMEKLNQAAEDRAERARHSLLYREIKPVLFFITASRKSSFSQFPAGVAGATADIPLHPLTRGQVGEFLRATAAFQHCTPHPDFVEKLHRQSGGVPAELIAFLEREETPGLFLDTCGKMHLAQAEDPSISFSGDAPPPPPTTKRLAGEMARLEPEAQKILHALSIACFADLMNDIPMASLENMLGIPQLRSHAKILEEKGFILVQGKEERLSFPPYSPLPLFLYERLDRTERERGHQEMAAFPEGSGHEALGSLSPDSLRAGFHLVKRLLYREGRVLPAIRVAREILSKIPVEREKLFSLFAALLLQALHCGGRHAEALDFFDRDLAPVMESKSLPRHCLYRSRSAILPALLETGQLERAEEMVCETLPLFDSPSLPACILRNYLGRAVFLKYHAGAGKSETFLEKARKIYEESGEMETRLDKRLRDEVRNNDLGLVLCALGRHREAAEKLTAKIGRLQRNPHLFAEFMTLTALAETRRMLKDLDGATQAANEALSLAQKTGKAKWIQHAHQILACLFQAQGMRLRFSGPREAARFIQEAIRENNTCLAAGGDAVTALLRLGQCHQEMGNGPLAREFFEAVSTRKSSPLYAAFAFLGLGECFMAEGQPERGEEKLALSESQLAHLPASLANHCRFKICLARAHLQAKKGNRARWEGYLKQMESLSGEDEELREEALHCRKIWEENHAET